MHLNYVKSEPYRLWKNPRDRDGVKRVNLLMDSDVQYCALVRRTDRSRGEMRDHTRSSVRIIHDLWQVAHFELIKRHYWYSIVIVNLLSGSVRCLRHRVCDRSHGYSNHARKRAVRRHETEHSLYLSSFLFCFTSCPSNPKIVVFPIGIVGREKGRGETRRETGGGILSNTAWRRTKRKPKKIKLGLIMQRLVWTWIIACVTTAIIRRW